MGDFSVKLVNLRRRSTLAAYASWQNGGTQRPLLQFCTGTSDGRAPFSGVSVAVMHAVVTTPGPRVRPFDTDGASVPCHARNTPAEISGAACKTITWSFGTFSRCVTAEHSYTTKCETYLKATLALTWHLFSLSYFSLQHCCPRRVSPLYDRSPPTWRTRLLQDLPWNVEIKCAECQ